MARAEVLEILKLILIYTDGAFEYLDGFISHGAFFALGDFLGFSLDARVFPALVLGQLRVSSGGICYMK